MNMKHMKQLDHYAGIPLCLLLDLFHKISAIFPAKKSITPPRKILLMKFFGMGSILLASPMLRGLRERYPDAEIGFLTFASNRSIVERLHLVDHIYSLSTASLTGFALDVVRQLWRIRRDGYDVTIDLEFFSKFSTIMTYLSGSGVRIGYFLRQLWRGDLLTEQIYYNHYRHITEVIAALVAPLDVRITDHTIQRPAFSDGERARATDLLASCGIGADDLVIGFNVNVSDLSLERRWPKENFQQLATLILRELDARLLFIGGGGEAGYVAEVLAPFSGNHRVINLSGQTSLGELMAVMTRFSLLITNDSGPLHLAAALNVPTVSFFGPETPVLYGPKGEDALVFHEALYCSPCLNVFNVKTAPCAGKNLCLQAISVSAVFDGIRRQYPWLWERYGRKEALPERDLVTEGI